MLRRPPRAGRRQRQGLVARGTRGANAENSAACYLLPTACAPRGRDMGASAAGNCATSCVGTATNSTACDCTATIDTANIGGATTAILVARVTISSGVIAAATGCHGSPSHDRSATLDGTASGVATTSDGTPSQCAR